MRLLFSLWWEAIKDQDILIIMLSIFLAISIAGIVIDFVGK